MSKRSPSLGSRSKPVRMREDTFRMAGKTLVEVTAGSRTREAILGRDGLGEKRGKRNGCEEANEDREAH